MPPMSQEIFNSLADTEASEVASEEASEEASEAATEVVTVASLAVAARWEAATDTALDVASVSEFHSLNSCPLPSDAVDTKKSAPLSLQDPSSVVVLEAKWADAVVKWEVARWAVPTVTEDTVTGAMAVALAARTANWSVLHHATLRSRSLRFLFP